MLQKTKAIANEAISSWSTKRNKKKTINKEKKGVTLKPISVTTQWSVRITEKFSFSTGKEEKSEQKNPRWCSSARKIIGRAFWGKKLKTFDTKAGNENGGSRVKSALKKMWRELRDTREGDGIGT